MYERRIRCTIARESAARRSLQRACVRAGASPRGATVQRGAWRVASSHGVIDALVEAFDQAAALMQEAKPPPQARRARAETRARAQRRVGERATLTVARVQGGRTVLGLLLSYLRSCDGPSASADLLAKGFIKRATQARRRGAARLVARGRRPPCLLAGH